MMFSAGMGIGLMFFAVAEPISHLTAPPTAPRRRAREAAAQQAMALSYFHWALTRGRSTRSSASRSRTSLPQGHAEPDQLGLPSAAGRPGPRADRAVDRRAWRSSRRCSAAPPRSASARRRSTAGSTSCGGSSRHGIAVAIIGVLTVAFVLSAVSGVEKGIQWLSNVNMLLAIAAGGLPAVRRADGVQLETLVESIGGYLTTIVPRASAPARSATASGSRPGRSSTGRGGSRGRRSSAPSSRASPRAGRSASSWSACC